ncbi:MAG: polyprenyl synthetase family protein [Streptosporangiales bacterium]|nr:polyprenyl synthetase family protein [Streptosporangiales bacterium]
MTGTGLHGDVRTAEEVLAASRARVQPALRDAVDTLPASTRHVAGYHFGWWDRHGRPADGSAGKAIRPALVLLAARATRTGADEAEPAVAAAAAVELVHNSSLLHDDVIDDDRTRRHRPTAWSVFGIGDAIMTGDALLVLAAELLSGCDPSTRPRALRTLGDAVQRLLDGQCADMALEARPDPDLAACTDMALGKTGALMGCACALGCLVAGGEPEQAWRFRRAGERLGLAFQHVDDLLGIWGDPAVTGKPVHSDLRNRKKSLPVVYALTSGTAAGRELAELFGRDGQPAPGELARAAELVETAGGRAWSHAQAGDLLTAARRELRSASPLPAAEAELTALARLIVRRDH